MSGGAVLLEDIALLALTVECSRCGRNGRYRLSTLIERYGPRAKGPDVLSAIRKASDCPNRDVDLTVRCQLRYPEMREPDALRR